MHRRQLPVLLPLLALVLVALPAAAEMYTVALTNGGSFDTRYRPEVATWDDGLLTIMTDVGNWIAIPRQEVVAITAETEVRGFGTVISTNTIALGWAPNDAPVPADEASADPRDRLLQLLERQLQPEPDYSIQQFVDPSDAGGIPVWMTRSNTPPLSGGSNDALSAGEPPQK